MSNRFFRPIVQGLISSAIAIPLFLILTENVVCKDYYNTLCLHYDYLSVAVVLIIAVPILIMLPDFFDKEPRYNTSYIITFGITFVALFITFSYLLLTGLGSIAGG